MKIIHKLTALSRTSVSSSKPARQALTNPSCNTIRANSTITASKSATTSTKARARKSTSTTVLSTANSSTTSATPAGSAAEKKKARNVKAARKSGAPEASALDAPISQAGLDANLAPAATSQGPDVVIPGVLAGEEANVAEQSLNSSSSPVTQVSSASTSSTKRPSAQIASEPEKASFNMNDLGATRTVKIVVYTFIAIMASVETWTWYTWGKARWFPTVGRDVRGLLGVDDARKGNGQEAQEKGTEK